VNFKDKIKKWRDCGCPCANCQRRVMHCNQPLCKSGQKR